MTTTNTNPTKEVAMSTFLVFCPCGRDVAVTAHDAGFSATTITVDGCAECKKDGVISREMRKSYGVVHVVLDAVAMHRDGMVTFG